MDPILSDDLQRQLMALFLVEAQEHIQKINQNLLVLEELPVDSFDMQLLAETLRETHSLKGAAQAVDLRSIEKLAHHLESLFVRLQNNRQGLMPDGYDVVYRSLDAISSYVKSISVSESPVMDESGLLTEIEALMSVYQTRSDQKPENDPAHNADPKKTEIPIKPGSGELNNDLTRNKQKEKNPEDIKEKDKPAKNEIKNPDHKDEVIFSAKANKPEETVRLATGKLDTLLSMMGELQVTRMGVMQDLIELQEIKEDVTLWEAEWRKVQNVFRHHINFQKEVDSAFNTPIKKNSTGQNSSLYDFLQENENNLHHLQERLNHLIRTFDHDNRRLEQVSHAMEEEIHKTRMLPVSNVFNTFVRMVRDLAHEKGKEAVLTIEGGEINVDRLVLEQIKDPLLHLLRNRIDHGIETPEERLKAGKPRKGSVSLKASHQGDSLVIEVADDGAGINLAAVRMAAVKRQILNDDSAKTLNDHDALWLIFHSGFSTSPMVSNISGRGVGLDIVRLQVERLHGLIDVENNPGKGVKFLLTVPLTVATTLCVLVKAGVWKFRSTYQDCIFAIPITNVLRLVRVKKEDIHAVEGSQVIRLNDEVIVVRSLTEILGLQEKPSNQSPAEKRPVIVVGAAEKRMAFLVDGVMETQELVLKSLPYPFLRVQNITAASMLGSGDIIPVLNVSGVLNTAENKKTNTAGMNLILEKNIKEIPLIMVADDSITTRTLEKNILESAGYRVQSAYDGLDAWTQLQTDNYDLLVSDVIMPRLNGFELTEKIREDEHYRQLPVILITSLDSAHEREQGIQAGADAYIVKSTFDQQTLLDTIKRLL